MRQLRMKKERLARNWTQSDLARKLSVTDASISMWENGIRFPRKTALYKLENIFQLTQRELFEEVN